MILRIKMLYCYDIVMLNLIAFIRNYIDEFDVWETQIVQAKVTKKTTS